MKSAAAISRAAASPQGNLHIRQSGKSEEYLLCVPEVYGPLLFDIETRELPKLSGIGPRQDYIAIELRIRCKQGSLSVRQLNASTAFSTTTSHAGLEALRQIRMEYGRRRYLGTLRDLQRMQGLNEYLQKQVERKGKSIRQGCHQSPRRRTASSYRPL